MKRNDIRNYIRALKKSPKFGSQIVCHRIIESSRPSFKSLDSPLDGRLIEALEKSHITDLYAHQATAVNLVLKQRDLVVATPTASGKSLIYNIPILQHYRTEPQFHALYLFPLKALAQDQMRVLAELYHHAEPDPKEAEQPFCAIYDGDTKPAQRTRLRKKTPPVIITNPDMVHRALLAYHDSWSGFFRNLRYVVIDEIHTYRGLFGSHMAWVLRRLMRIAEYYGSSPRFIMLSATVGNPAQLGEKLIGRPVDVITRSGAPTGKKHMLFLNPWDSAAHTASQLLEAAVKRGLRTIVYTKSRKMTELITLWTKPRIGDLAGRLRSYRAGFLPEERRGIERSLATGELLGVISTSALELGIDIGDLDLCILVGYPGSVMATWQRGGRVGRRSKESAVIMVGGEDALDQHFMKNPDDFFKREPEHAALNPFNQRITRQHLHCAAAEVPLHGSEPLLQGAPELLDEIESLTEEAILHRDAYKTCWYASRKKPQNLVGLRGGGVQMSIIDQ
ncbi:MAG: DEAD/DEAH box helicase, partial [Desulfofustis sp.]